MKLFHLSDLHLGKRVNEFSMLEDQQYILSRILEWVHKEKPDVLILAGDIYDKAVPSAEAVSLFDWFLTELADRACPVCIVSGNHDSAERLAFGARLMNARNIFLSPVYEGKVETVDFKDSLEGSGSTFCPLCVLYRYAMHFPRRRKGSLIIRQL